MPQSYKIYINDLPLVIANHDQISAFSENSFVSQHFENDIAGTLQWIYDNRPFMGMLVPTHSAEQLMQRIKNELRLVVAAGGLVWNKYEELLMIYRKGKWDLPKGKLEPKEGIETAAIREVMEETGIENLQITGKMDNSYHIYKDHGQLLLKETHWYTMSSDYEHVLVPQAKEGITEVLWVKKSGVPEKLTNTYGSVRDLLGEGN